MRLVITSVVVPHVSTIYNSTFYGCTSLTSATMHRVQNIWNSAFFECTKLSSVVIPETVKYIGKEAFSNTNLRTLYFLAQYDINVGTNAFYNISRDNHGHISNISTSITHVYIKNICDKYKYAELLSLPVRRPYFLAKTLSPVLGVGLMATYLIKNILLIKTYTSQNYSVSGLFFL